MCLPWCTVYIEEADKSTLSCDNFQNELIFFYSSKVTNEVVVSCLLYVLFFVSLGNNEFLMHLMYFNRWFQLFAVKSPCSLHLLPWTGHWPPSLLPSLTTQAGIISLSSPRVGAGCFIKQQSFFYWKTIFRYQNLSVKNISIQNPKCLLLLLTKNAVKGI